MAETKQTSVDGVDEDPRFKKKYLRASRITCATCTQSVMMVRAIIDNFSMQLECPKCGYSTSTPWDGVRED